MLAELATALRGLGKHAEAQRCCTAAVTARPDYQRGWLELGQAQAAQGQSLIIDRPLISISCMLQGMQEEIYS
jgi:predicted Zn-dependent protease